MNRIISSVLAPSLIFGVFFLTEEVVAQTPKELVGTWTIFSITLEKDAKKETDLFGASPQGRRIIDADGHVFSIVTSGGLPKFASNNRATATPEENKAVVQGSFTYFGTIVVNGADRGYTQHIEVCTLSATIALRPRPA